jgi:hypothetical protein
VGLDRSQSVDAILGQRPFTGLTLAFTAAVEVKDHWEVSGAVFVLSGEVDEEAKAAGGQLRERQPVLKLQPGAPGTRSGKFAHGECPQLSERGGFMPLPPSVHQRLPRTRPASRRSVDREQCRGDRARFAMHAAA